MQAFTKLTGVAAPLPIANVDTDKIIPARFLKTIKRTGLGVHLFDTLRYDAEGRERPDFVLNREPWRRVRSPRTGKRVMMAGEMCRPPLTSFISTCLYARSGLSSRRLSASVRSSAARRVSTSTTARISAGTWRPSSNGRGTKCKLRRVRPKRCLFRRGAKDSILF